MNKPATHTPNVDALVEARRIAIVAALSTFVVSVAFLSGFRTPAALLAAIGFAAVLERLHRLFHRFRRQGRRAALFRVVVVGVLAAGAVGAVLLAAVPMHSHRS
ncbi:putative PurR-regulated permease PerM [Dokdonella fugitiva]|uniref:Putative PurR-regulated permease PerM n=1 Tax=Dokdonella fugitiva TaxID=328517 RepID=A0A839F834_9GAMM|nr:hypothetical protein [Dokdonella fugitiva]MBA8889899.1 putative PurR-regulated permease PerM [Dokdonella fugitiva]